MKKYQILFAFLFLFPLFIYSQNYRPIVSSRISYFKTSVNSEQNNKIYGFKIDSITLVEDSFFYPVNNIIEINTNVSPCVSVDNGAWLAKKIRVDTLGNTWLYNYKDDSFYIKNINVLNENWTATVFEDSSYIIASVVKLDTITFLGLKDSLKIINFQVFDRNKIKLKNKINNYQLIISQHYGIIRSPGFHHFSKNGFEININSEKIDTNFNLIGISDSSKGFQDFGNKEIFNFEPGDEIDIDYYYGHPPYYGNQTLTKIFFLELLDTINGYTYKTFEVEKKISKPYPDKDPTIKITYSTKTRFYSFNNELERFPMESNFNTNASNNQMVNSVYDLKDELESKNLMGSYGEQYRLEDSCWSQWVPLGNKGKVQGVTQYYKYIKGLGGPYYEESVWPDDPMTSYVRLIYYKKKDREGGIPFDFNVGISELRKSKIKLIQEYGRLKVLTENPQDQMNLSLFNTNGQLVLEAKNLKSNSEIQLPNLVSGIYFYKAVINHNLFDSGKLVIMK